MKKIVLKKLSLTDFRGQSGVFDFGSINEIQGKNGSGKSTIKNAFFWLLMGVDEYNRTNYQIFDTRVEQTHENSKLAIVEGVFDIDGLEYTFKRAASIGWIRPNGKETYERKGSDNYKFYIDDIERSATDFKRAIEETFAPIEKLKVMLNVRHYTMLDWKERRKMLEEILKNMPLINIDDRFPSVAEGIKKYGVDKYKEQLQSKLKNVKEQTTRLPSEIEGMKSVVPSEDEITRIEQRISEIKSELTKVDEDIEGGKASCQRIESTRNVILSKVADKETEMYALINNKSKSINEEINVINSQLLSADVRNREILAKLAEYDRKMVDLAKERESLLVELSQKEEYVEKLRKENADLKNLQFTDDKCALCGNTLPPDMLERNKALFNEKRESKRQSIITEGRREVDNIERIKKRLGEIKEIINDTFAPSVEMISTKDLNARIVALRVQLNNIKESESVKSIQREIESLRETLPTTANIDISKSLSKRRELENELELLVSKNARNSRTTIIEKINIKNAELKNACAEKAEIEGMIAQVTNYAETKARMVSEQVNSLFELVHVEIEEQDKSGKIVPTCKFTVKGVNDSVTNNASVTLAGIDLSNTLCKFYELNLPLFIDNAESINDFNIPQTDRQQFKLSVLNCDLRVVC